MSIETGRKIARRRRDTKLVRLVARDGANCHICGQPVDITLRVSGGVPESPSLDHIIPFHQIRDTAEIPLWDIRNLKLAHRSCNGQRNVEAMRQASILNGKLLDWMEQVSVNEFDGIGIWRSAHKDAGFVVCIGDPEGNKARYYTSTTSLRSALELAMREEAKRAA